MNKPTIYLAIDKDGTEKMSNLKLVWLGTSGQLYYVYHTINYREDQYNTWSNLIFHPHGDSLIFKGVILPEGTIEKLLGYRLLPGDSPIELV